MKLIEYTYDSTDYNGKVITHTTQSIEILNQAELKSFAFSNIVTQYVDWICEDIFHEKDGKIEIWVDHLTHRASRVALMKHEELFTNDVVNDLNGSNVYLEMTKFRLRIAALDVILSSKEEMVNSGHIIYINPSMGFNQIKPENIISEIEISDINDIIITYPNFRTYQFKIK